MIIQQLKDHDMIGPFLCPVNEKLSGAPDYYKVIKHPMDLGTIESKLLGSRYSDFEEFHRDMELMWDNSYKYNAHNRCMMMYTQSLDRFYRKLAGKEIPKSEKVLKKGKGKSE
jgi:hypothetical protein